MRLTRRFRHTRPARIGAYRLGEALGDRVLVGTTPGGSPIALSMRDHQHRSIYFHGEHEPDVTALFRRLVQPGCTVFDVGANAGYYAILAAELGASVHAFEPNPQVRALLSRSVILGTGEIQVVAAACSERQGRMPFSISEPGNTGMSSLGPGTGACIEVDVLTLDGYASAGGLQPDLLKIDVEGHEREVLAGAERVLRSARPVVIVETGGRDTLDLMARFGYLPERILADGSTAPHDGRLELIGGFENICFVPSSERPLGLASQLTKSPPSRNAERENGPRPVTENSS